MKKKLKKICIYKKSAVADEFLNLKEILSGSSSD